MATERLTSETDIYVVENEAFRWFQGYGEVAPALGAVAMKRIGRQNVEQLRDIIATFPKKRSRRAGMYFAGFPTEVIDRARVEKRRPVEYDIEPVAIASEVETVAEVEVAADIETVPVAPLRRQERRLAEMPRVTSEERPLVGFKHPVNNTDASRAMLQGVMRIAVELDEDASPLTRGLCSQTDPEAFFPEKGGSTREAKKVCAQCGIRDECLAYALEHDERFGIWGGLSERERRRLKKRVV